jgi:hypothetical protein
MRKDTSVDPVRLKKMDSSLRNERTVPVHDRTGKKKGVLEGNFERLRATSSSFVD